MNLAAMQAMLGRIYDTPINFPVDDYLLTKRAGLPERSSSAEEQLLVLGEGDTAYVSLFIAAEVVERLQQHAEPWQLGQHNLADWLTALEGVSHFQYLTFHASHDRPVSLVELELQAEVDKFVSCVEVLLRQSPERYPAEVMPQLFSMQYRPDPALPAPLAARYRDATRGAARFCEQLDRSLKRRRDWRTAFAALRRFYRWPLSRKLALIDA